MADYAHVLYADFRNMYINLCPLPSPFSQRVKRAYQVKKKHEEEQTKLKEKPDEEIPQTTTMVAKNSVEEKEQELRQAADVNSLRSEIRDLKKANNTLENKLAHRNDEVERMHEDMQAIPFVTVPTM